MSVVHIHLPHLSEILFILYSTNDMYIIKDFLKPEILTYTLNRVQSSLIDVDNPPRQRFFAAAFWVSYHSAPGY